MKTFIFILFAVILSTIDSYAQSISGIINIYTPVLEINAETCRPYIVVNDSKGFSIGDKVLIIQMQGANLDSSNTPEYGKINNYSNSGNHEFSRISTIEKNTIYLERSLLKGYTISGKVQLIRVPEYNEVTVKDSVTCPAWDGSVGGVIVIHSKGNVTLNGNISANGKGFRGGKTISSTKIPSYHVTDYKGSIDKPGYYGRKGEGIGGIGIDSMIMGRGAPANGGGGGNNHNAGGGGGSNGGCGGLGGFAWIPIYTGDYTHTRGIGGKELDYSIPNVIFLGGGGGSGHANQDDPSSGGNGGGIIIIVSNKITGNNNYISSCGLSTSNTLPDGAGGGGAGGTILMVSDSIMKLKISAFGGKGGNNLWTGSDLIAPGGGGGGGVVLFKQSSSPTNILIDNKAGSAGFFLNLNDHYGSTDGCDGRLYFNASILENKSAITPSTSAQLNLYNQVKAIDASKLNITIAGSGNEYCPGNKLLIIQMRGAEVNSTPTNTYGKVTSYQDAGNYEFTRVESITENTITLKKPLIRSYNPTGKVQILRVPEFQNYTLSNKLICPKWNDTIFGVFALTVLDTLRLQQSIIADGTGFSGGNSKNAPTTSQVHFDVYFGHEDSSKYALKGDGISNYLSADHRAAKGAVANAGGGGNNHNAGGGGGASGGCGGLGGFGWDLMVQGDEKLSQGIGGYAADNSGNKIYMGGGGGAGHSNEGSGTSGGAGGGIIILEAKVIIVEGGQISSNGASVKHAPYDGAGGGGGGGTILLKTNKIIGKLFLESYGGSGGGVTIHRDGPGGGGGGGVIGFTLPAVPTGAQLDFRGGYGGKSRLTQDYGQTDGCIGVTLTNLDIPGDNSILGGFNDELPTQSETVTVYPLPADELVTISPNKSFIATSCKIYDILGNHIGNGMQSHSGDWQINVGLLNAGVFFAVLTSDSSSKIVRLIVRH